MCCPHHKLKRLRLIPKIVTLSTLESSAIGANRFHRLNVEPSTSTSAVQKAGSRQVFNLSGEEFIAADARRRSDAHHLNDPTIGMSQHKNLRMRRVHFRYQSLSQRSKQLNSTSWCYFYRRYRPADCLVLQSAAITIARANPFAHPANPRILLHDVSLGAVTSGILGLSLLVTLRKHLLQ